VNLTDSTDIDTGDLQKMADAFSRTTKTTAIYLGRIGVEGTSGNHMSRKTLLELHMLNGALDAIKRRHGYEGFHLVGQSGGSKLVGGLIGLRRDVACAVAGSGPMTVPGSPKQTDPSRAYFDVVETIPALAQNRSLRLLLVSDPADKTVPLAQQAGFVEKMRRAGSHVPQFMVEATDDHHHGVVAYAQLIAAGCMLGRSDADIARAVGTMTRRAAEFNQRKANEASAKAAGNIARRQPGREPGGRPVGFNAGTTSK
jgi:hypothetical protein